VRIARFLAAMLILVNLHAVLLQAEPARVGTTFSPRQCKYLGQDWKKTYLEILDMGFEIIRLGAYWDQIEKEKDVYDFTDLDWQIKQAKKKRIPILLTVGMKAPRWPEFFIPKWVLRKVSFRLGEDVSSNEYLRERTLKFIKEVVGHYKNERIIHYWQVENEPLNRSGPRYLWIDKEFLKQEVDLVRTLDRRNRPIVINVATYPHKFLRFLYRIIEPNDPISEALELCDILALNVYPVVGQKIKWFNLRFWTTPDERIKYLSRIVSLAKERDKKVWATELQAEPWEPGQLVYKGKKEPTTCWPELFQSAFKELRALGIDTIFLWGSEFWLFRKTHYGDDSWVDTALGLI